MTIAHIRPEQHFCAESWACADVTPFLQRLECQREDDMPRDPLEKARV